MLIFNGNPGSTTISCKYTAKSPGQASTCCLSITAFCLSVTTSCGFVATYGKCLATSCWSGFIIMNGKLVSTNKEKDY